MRSWVLGLTIVGMIVAVLNYQSVTSMANRMGASVLYPVLCIQQHATAWWQQRAADRETMQSLRQRIAMLERERRQLLQELIAVYAAHHHGDVTAQLKRFKERVGAHNGVIARVLVTHVDGQEHFLLVEGGQRRLVTTDMIALVDGHMIGRVMAVFDYYCKVVLITDKRVNIAAYCAQTGASGIYHGCSQNNQGQLAFVDHLQAIVVGDTVLSSGQGLVYPEGLCLGTVTTCSKSGVERQITVQPRIDIQRIEHCLLVHPAQLITAGL